MYYLDDMSKDMPIVISASPAQRSPISSSWRRNQAGDCTKGVGPTIEHGI
jgi:hypothetical protein